MASVQGPRFPASLFLAVAETPERQNPFVNSGLSFAMLDIEDESVHYALPSVLKGEPLCSETLAIDLHCFSWECGRLRLKSGAPIAQLFPKDKAKPDDRGFVHDSFVGTRTVQLLPYDDPDDKGFVHDSIVDSKQDGSTASARFFLAAVCPNPSCRKMGLIRLHATVVEVYGPQFGLYS